MRRVCALRFLNCDEPLPFIPASFLALARFLIGLPIILFQNIPWTVDVEYTGHVAAWYKDKNGHVVNKFFPVGEIRHVDLECLGHAKALFRAQGQFRGVSNQGLEFISQKEDPGAGGELNRY